jgi:hypothetical protein
MRLLRPNAFRDYSRALDIGTVSVRALPPWQTSFFELGLSETQREFGGSEPPSVPLSIQPEIAT